MFRFQLAAALSLAVACASSSQGPAPAAVKTGEAQPEIRVIQLSNVANAARHMTGGVSIQYRIAIRNPRIEAIHIRRIDMQSVGMGAYNLASFSRAFDDVIAPNETKSVDMWAAASIDDATIVGANGPVTIRAIVRYETSGQSHQTVVVQQVNAAGGGS